MDECKLCKSHAANQTGSHIIPFFLIKSLVNENPQDKRDKEQSFKISSSQLVSFYMGRNLSPEKIGGLLGRELTDEEIQKNLNHYTCDNVLCSFCEKRLQIIESRFSNVVYTKIKNSNRLALHKKLKFTDNIKVQPELVRLFFLTIIWRCAVTHFLNLKLEPAVQEKMRKILHLGLSDKDETLNDSLDLIKDDVKEFPMGLLYEVTPDDSTRNFCFSHQNNRAPYYFIFNEFIVLFYHKRKTMYQALDACFGLETLRFKPLINFREDVFRIGLVEKNEWSAMRQALIKHVARTITKRLENAFILAFQSIRGERPPKYLLHSLMRELTLGDHAEFADNYTIPRITSVFSRFIFI